MGSSLDEEWASCGMLTLKVRGVGRLCDLVLGLIDTFLLKTNCAISDSYDSRILVGEI